MDWLLFARSGRVVWWGSQCLAIFGLTVLFQHLGWLS